MPKFNGTELTPETIQATRQWFADNADACVREAEDGTAPLASHYPLAKYRAEKAADKADALAGKYDRSLTFLQRAYYIQTGESVALLP
jgi:hypothetical protein